MKTKILLSTTFIFIICALQAQIIYVPGDYSTIQEGINAASDGDTVLVAEDTYYENIKFMGKAITVASNFIMEGDTNYINNTIIDGSQPDNPNIASVVTFMNGEDTTSVLTGFTITGGTGLEIAEKRMGGGIVCFQSGAKIVYNKIMNNEVMHSDRAGGAGICSYYDAGETWIIVENNIISSNTSEASNISAFGGGIYAGTNAIIKNNIIENNQCNCEFLDADGGGIETENLYGNEDTIYITNNIISYNIVTAQNLARGGGLTSFNSVLFIHNNIISYDSLSADRTNGSGMYIKNSPYTEVIGNNVTYNTVNKINIYWGVGTFIVAPIGPTIVMNNEYSYNFGEHTPTGAGGGFSVIDAFDIPVLVKKNIFLNNSAYHGGGFYERSCYNLQLINNLFSENDSYRGGAIGMFHPLKNTRDLSESKEDFHPRIINNTFFSNSASNNAGAIRSQCDQIPPVIINCIFHENEAPIANDLYNLRDDTVFVSFSNINPDFIEGNWSSLGNINEDPKFVNSGDYPYQINDYSPCIDAGKPDTTGLNLPEDDLAGEDRIFNIRVDMGAYEWNTFVGAEEFRISGLMSGVSTYPNPFTNSTTISYELNQATTVQIIIYNHLGDQIAVIVEEQLWKGKHSFTWHNVNLPSGVYYCVLRTNNENKTTKMIKLK